MSFRFKAYFIRMADNPFVFQRVENPVYNAFVQRKRAVNMFFKQKIESAFTSNAVLMKHK